MRITFVSRFPPTACGIGEYTRYLAQGILANEPSSKIEVVAEGDAAGPRHLDGVDVVATYDHRGRYVDAVFDAITRTSPDIVHLQHAPDLFGEDGRVLDLVLRLRAANHRVVLTPHTVHRNGAGRATGHQVALASAVNAVVAHQRRSMAEVLVAGGVHASRVHVIPHGTARSALPDASRARESLGLPPRATVLLFFGFLHLYKNPHTLLEAFLASDPDRHDAVLVFAGKPFGDSLENRAFVRALQLRARASSARERVRFFVEYVPDERMREFFAAADVVCLPHAQRYGSASGVMHLALGAGKPVLCTDGPKFENVREALVDAPECFVRTGWLGDWRKAVRTMISDTDVRARCGEAVRVLAESTAWPVVAARHLELYRSL